MKLLKCVHNPPPGLSPREAKDFEDENSVLLRAYGNDTSILIDRERVSLTHSLSPVPPPPTRTAKKRLFLCCAGECSSHLLLSRHGLAPPLLARFANGLLYRFVAGRVCSVDDLAMPATWSAVARRLGQWHGVLPAYPAGLACGSSPTAPAIDLWGVLHKWIQALPAASDAQKTQKEELTRELVVLETAQSSGGHGLKGQDGGWGLVTGHCDLLNGNVIILPGAAEAGKADSNTNKEREVHLIDYEYATPCERAFDIANHFAEWGGFECDYAKLPTRSTRREFIRVYLASFHAHRKDGLAVTDAEVDGLMDEVDLFRGVPGFYWSVVSCRRRCWPAAY